MYKNKKANINALILDEISSGLDSEGRNCLIKVLTEFKELNKCIVLIDNSELDPDNFDKAYEVKIEKGFSVIKEVEL